MNNYLTGALVSCCVLLSIGMVVIFSMTICFLYRVNKVLKKVNRVTTLLNFETKFLAPLMFAKRLLLKWLRKKHKHTHFMQKMDDLFDDDETHSWTHSLFQGVKWTAAVLLIWSAFRNKD
ncbi:hypothetical protein [Chlamydia sp. 17-3921]|uniref:hypothetical protein n=1 Tax=Chlamydia sp. 17-3921 TaxID=2675798 RepID=UPI00191AC810|nr:hypothetical protein [Chlamydia sp. 17-3921]